MGEVGPSGGLRRLLRTVQFSARAAAEARRRADAAAAEAVRREQRARAEPSRARRHLQIAAMHRDSEARHRTAEMLHADFLSRVEKQAVEDAGAFVPPGLMSIAASTCGWRGAVLTLRARGGGELRVAATDAAARRAHALEVVLAEGPSLDALDGRTLAVDVAELSRRWPRYGSAVGRLGVQAAAAVPLELSSRNLAGALTVLGPSVPDGGRSLVGDVAVALTETVLTAPDSLQLHDAGLPSLLAFGDEESQACLYQAAGVLRDRWGWGRDDAVAVIRAHAYAEERSVDDVADQVVRGNILGS